MAKLTYGIIGHPVKHSLSPAMHNAAFKEIGLEAEYVLRDVEPQDLEKFLAGASSSNISGFNVTIPHKIHVKEYLEKNGSLDENARRCGAVNTVKVAGDGGLCGYNTDGPGFYRSLVEDLGFEPEGKNVLILGAGGAALAIAMYLGNGPKKIFVSDIDEKKLTGLVSHYRSYCDKDRIVPVRQDELKVRIPEAHLLVNATPVGMAESDPSPVNSEYLKPGMYVYDLVYNHRITKLVREASIRKCRATTGLGMLLYQGTIAFEIWTGRSAPAAVMKKALREALKSEVKV